MSCCMGKHHLAERFTSVRLLLPPISQSMDCCCMAVQNQLPCTEENGVDSHKERSGNSLTMVSGGGEAASPLSSFVSLT